MVRLFPKAFLFAAGFVFALTACNDGVKQYPRDTYAPTQPNLDKILSDNEALIDEALPKEQKTMGVEGVDGAGKAEKKSDAHLSEEENRARVSANTKQPIVFGVGAAGITLQTPMAKAHSILSEPQAGEDDDGFIGYQEGIGVIWKRDKPRVPDQITINGSYMGQFVQLSKAFPNKGGVTVKTQFEEEFAVDGGKGYDLLKKIVRAVLNKDEKFDCINEGICSIEARGSIIRMTFPSGLIAFSADRKSLYGAALVPTFNMGRLDNSVDVILGQVVDKASNTTIRVGEAWSVVREQITTDTPNTIVGSNQFIKDYTDMAASVTRSKYDRSYVLPADNEILKGFIALRSYSHPIKFRNQFIKVEKSNNGLDLNFIDESKVTSKQGLLRLGMSNLSGRSTAIPFLDKLNEKILEKMQEEYGAIAVSEEQQLISSVYKPVNSNLDLTATSAFAARNNSTIIAQRMTGLQRSVSKGLIETSTFVYDLKRRTGMASGYAFDMGKSSFARFTVTKLMLPSDYSVALSAAYPVSAKQHQLLGIQLGKSIVELSDVDLGRKEAQVKVVLADGTTLNDHANVLKPSVELALTYADANEVSKEEVVNTATVDISSFPDVRLYLSNTSANPKLIAVETSQFMAGITDICGLKKFQPRRTQSAKSFMQEYTNAVKEAKKLAEKEKKSFECLIGSEKDKDGTGEIKTITFIRDQVKFKFTNNELSSVIFY